MVAGVVGLGQDGCLGTEASGLSYVYERCSGAGSLCVVKFLIWCVLLVVCWPLALVAIVVYPIIWLLLLPFR